MSVGHNPKILSRRTRGGEEETGWQCYPCRDRGDGKPILVAEQRLGHYPGWFTHRGDGSQYASDSEESLVEFLDHLRLLGLDDTGVDQALLLYALGGFAAGAQMALNKVGQPTAIHPVYA